MKPRLSRCLAVLLTLPLCIGGLAVADETASEAEPTLRVVGLRMLEGLPDEDDNRMLRMKVRQAEGTTLTLRVDYPRGALLKLSDKSTFDVVTDDKGKDLALTSSGERSARIGFTRFNRSRRLALIDLRAPQLPSKGAVSMRAKGKLVFQASAKRVTQRSEAGALTKGTKLVTKTATYEITRVRAIGAGQRTEINLRALEVEGLVHAARLLDADGKVIASDGYGVSRSRQASGMWAVTRSFYVMTVPETVRVEIDVWNPIREIEMPFDLPIKVGF